MAQPGNALPDERVHFLTDGSRMPLLGLGVWQVPDGPDCYDATRWALELGYRHLDTAQAYGNEKSVGAALKHSGVAREDVFITTKFYPGRDDPAHEIEGSLRRLGLDYVDLYLVHWPQSGATWAWPGMERAHELGHARSIGVSNFDVDELEQVLAIATVRPTVNQVQFNPTAYRQRLLAEGIERGIALEAYSPLGTGRLLTDPTVNEIASRIGRTPAQVLLRWCLQHDVPVVAKSTRRERLQENAESFEFELTAADLATLDGLDRTGGTAEALNRKWWS